MRKNEIIEQLLSFILFVIIRPNETHNSTVLQHKILIIISNIHSGQTHYKQHVVHNKISYANTHM